MTEVDKSIPIVKKLKITGTPFKIKEKTAFIKVSKYNELKRNNSIKKNGVQ